jgi:AraC-like DNA-binding protein
MTAPLTHDAPTLTPTVRGVVRGHVVTAVNILRTRLAEPWTLSLLADEVHLSRSQVAQAFGATVGMSPMAYLSRMRVERMARLLASTDLSIAEASRAVGWNDPNYASRTFRYYQGVSPTGYRRQHSAPPIG